MGTRLERDSYLELPNTRLAASKSYNNMADKLGLKPQKKIELFSANYFAACTLGGVIACGPTHTMVTPLDLVCLDSCPARHIDSSYIEYQKLRPERA